MGQQQSESLTWPIERKRSHSGARVLKTLAILFGLWGVGSTIVGRGFTALVPGLWDAQLFAYIGRQWLDGRMPYLEMWDNKPPGLMSLVAFIFAVAPNNFKSLAVAEGILVLGCLAAVYLLMRKLRAPHAACFLALFVASIACNLKFYNMGGNLTETYLLFPEVLSMYCFIKGLPRFQGKWIFLAGVFSGVAALFKPVGLAPVLAQTSYLFFLTLKAKSFSPHQILKFILIGGSGVVASWMPFCLYFAMHNALGEMIYACLLSPFLLGAAAQKGFLHPLSAIATNLEPVSTLVAGSVVGAYILLRQLKEASRPELALDDSNSNLYAFLPLVLLWVLFDLAGALAGGRGLYRHYFLCLAPSLSVAAGLSYWHFLKVVPERIAQRDLKLGLFLIFAIPLLFQQAFDVHELLNLIRDREPQYVRPEDPLTQKLNELRRPDDTLFVWEFLPDIYWTTEMKSPVRQMFGFRIFLSPKFHERFGEEILQDLAASPPTYIVDGWVDDPKRVNPHDSVYIRFEGFVHRNYNVIFEVGNLRLCKRLAGNTPP
jgi:hypothetical protein